MATVSGDRFADFVKNVLRVTLSPEQESFLGMAVKPKFNVGDAVRVKAGSPVFKYAGTLDSPEPPNWAFGEKLEVSGNSKLPGQLSVIRDSGSTTIGENYLEPWNDAEEWNGEKWVAKKVEKWPDSYFQKPAIVISRTNGVLKPATHPFVHPSAIEAELEAKRLAELVKGEEFVVFEEVGSRRVEKSKAEKMVEELGAKGGSFVYHINGKDIAEIDHTETSATGNVVTVKYHLKP